ncbi:MAG: GNAT family N-acetyltransferase [Ignavibacteria bacterium]|nr:GNAT family N-acetyltransferase [Ignavibacteria bacterium]
MNEACQIAIVPFTGVYYSDEVALRTRVLRKPLGMQYTREQLQEDDSDVHLHAMIGDQLAGCLLLRRIDSHLFQIRQVAVKPEVQRKGIGTQLVLKAETLVREQGGSNILLHSRKTAIPFYQTLGYSVISEEYIEVSLPHRTMQKILE